MDARLRIRPVDGASFEAAFGLLRRFFREEGFGTPAGAMRAALHGLLADPASAVYLAWRGQQAVGVATVTTTAGLEYGRCAEMEDLYVLPEARHSGVATALIAAVAAWCRAQGCTALQIIVTPEGEAQHGLVDYYARRGFAHTGRVVLEQRL